MLAAICAETTIYCVGVQIMHNMCGVRMTAPALGSALRASVVPHVLNLTAEGEHDAELG